MSKILQKKIETESQFSNCTVLTETIFQLPSKEQFDTIIYIDVLEHIQDDKAEMKRAFDLLCAGGHLIILSPAHNFLFSSFDKEIGHFRRLELIELQYLDSIGFFALLAYKFFWNRPYPSKKQIGIWDQYIIPVSKRTDRIFFNAFGKSILGVWRK
jgi:2-polyprenyl-3-methyl-5-hydroxy-6-metoxy-1,4-benzoquinol methylase